jgi:hypothetical protein
MIKMMQELTGDGLKVQRSPLRGQDLSEFCIGELVEIVLTEDEESKARGIYLPVLGKNGVMRLEGNEVGMVVGKELIGGEVCNLEILIGSKEKTVKVIGKVCDPFQSFIICKLSE